jgi:hypothetical protein
MNTREYLKSIFVRIFEMRRRELIVARIINASNTTINTVGVLSKLNKSC